MDVSLRRVYQLDVDSVSNEQVQALREASESSGNANAPAHKGHMSVRIKLEDRIYPIGAEGGRTRNW